ncbi:MAG: AtpZ/AtpI family protein [Caldilineaceae bacterium]|nr:AtpZ/AtpI family protein [Caldilineaceae bacterium]MCB0128835.1 AtpZ/AtpI family protein [Caldilineaceae bacterium]
MAEPTNGSKLDADDAHADPAHKMERELDVVVGKKAARKLRARRSHRVLWFGLGMFGMIGWSIAVPMLLAIALGIWVDRRWPSPYSWTLMLLFGGVILGCLNAWYWVQRERRLIAREWHGDEPPEIQDTEPR